MKSYVATLATTLLVCLTGGLAHGQAPCCYGQQQAPCNYAQCGQGEQVYLVLKPIHRSCEPSSHWLIGGNLFNGCKSKDNCGCDEPKCSHARCSEPCHEQPCYAQAPCNEGRCNECRCNEGRCNEGRCNEGRCNEGHFNHLSAGCYPVRVVPCATCNQCAGYYDQPNGQPNGQPYGPPNGRPYGPRGPQAGAPTTGEPPVAEANAYIPLIQAIQAAQEKDNRAMREMMENRQATLSLVRAIQTSDASTVASFEKMLQQMKDTNTVRESGK